MTDSRSDRSGARESFGRGGISAFRERRAIHHKRGAGETIETTMPAGGPIIFDPPGLKIDLGEVFAALD